MSEKDVVYPPTEVLPRHPEAPPLEEASPDPSMGRFSLDYPVQEAIRRVMEDMGAIGKTKKNEQQKYMFRSIDDCYNELHPLFAKHGIYTAPIAEDHQLVDRSGKDGKFIGHVIVRMRYEIVGPRGDKQIVRTFGEAMDWGDKATNKAMTAAHKYALTQAFCIAFKDLEDADASSPQPPVKQAAAAPKADIPKDALKKPTPPAPPPPPAPAAKQEEPPPPAQKPPVTQAAPAAAPPAAQGDGPVHPVLVEAKNVLEAKDITREQFKITRDAVVALKKSQPEIANTEMYQYIKNLFGSVKDRIEPTPQ